MSQPQQQQQNPAQRGDRNYKEDKTEYLTQLRTELGQLDQSLSNCNRLVQEGKTDRKTDWRFGVFLKKYNTRNSILFNNAGDTLK